MYSRNEFLCAHSSFSFLLYIYKSNNILFGVKHNQKKTTAACPPSPPIFLWIHSFQIFAMSINGKNLHAIQNQLEFFGSGSLAFSTYILWSAFAYSRRNISGWNEQQKKKNEKFSLQNKNSKNFHYFLHSPANTLFELCQKVTWKIRNWKIECMCKKKQIVNNFGFS